VNGADLVGLATRMSGQGLTAIVLDLIAPETRSFGATVKVLVPEMVPLSQDHRARWLATPRLVAAATFATDIEKNFNPYPHPFA
jgi:ribosomal protein S12 methylthiotransferase accessory factor